MAILIQNPGMGEWLAERTSRIGGSEAAAAIGLDPYKTRQELAQEKLGLVQTTEPNEAMEWGTALEPVVRDRFRQKSGMLVEYPGQWALLVHDEHKFLAMTPDGFVSAEGRDGKGVLQIKVTSQEPWESPPLHYLAQVQHEMLVTGLSWSVIAALHRGNHLKWYVVERHEKFQQKLLQEETAFWECIKAGRLPEPDLNKEEEVRAYVRTLLHVDEGKTVTLPKELLELHHERMKLSAEVKEAKRRLDAINDRFKLELGDAASGVFEGTDIVYRAPLVEKGEHVVKAQKYRMLTSNKDKKRGGGDD